MKLLLTSMMICGVLTTCIEAHNACLNHIRRIERIEGIPKNVLEAIGRVESGRYNEQTRTVEPWPWAIQAEGKAHYFTSRSEAANHIKDLMDRGVTNIDVGCMQINIGHHGHHFASIDHMLDPAQNVRYAATFLKDLKSKGSQTWSQAIGNYHSTTEVHHKRYKDLVYKNIRSASKDDHIRRVGEKLHKGSIYPLEDNVSSTNNGPSLHVYSRTYGLNRTGKPIIRRGNSLVTPTAHKREALMRLKGVNDTKFMKKDK